ncbi:hypothetical protein [Agromyces ramosus]|uniref:hypothetical protein n=1 Tax=Agromyces ramosus TaxID=33879 RepID=UPI0027D8FFB3|nr:hypothetical protein [Agromyces ramosus]
MGVLSHVAVHPHTNPKELMITLTWLLIIALIGGALALVDGILRLRGRGGSTIIGVIELVVAALFLLSLFLPGIPFGSLVLGIVTLIVLVVALFLGGRTGRAITIAALVFIAVWLVLLNRWIVIPGVN